MLAKQRRRQTYYLLAPKNAGSGANALERRVLMIKPQNYSDIGHDAAVIPGARLTAS